MGSSTKKAETNRHHGGPGSSHQRPDLPDPTEEVPTDVEPTHGRKSKVSGGGGERDSHHTRDPSLKGGKGI